MSKNKAVFSVHSDAQQKQYEREARLQYGPDNVNESIRRWNSYTQDERDAIMEEGSQIYVDIAAAIDAGLSPTHPDVTALLDRWQAHLHYFYEPTLDILRGLGDLYNMNPDFIANFEKIHPDLPPYLQQAIAQYVDDLETIELERMLAEDEALSQRQNRLSL